MIVSSFSPSKTQRSSWPGVRNLLYCPGPARSRTDSWAARVGTANRSSTSNDHGFAFMMASLVRWLRRECQRTGPDRGSGPVDLRKVYRKPRGSEAKQGILTKFREFMSSFFCRFRFYLTDKYDRGGN